MSSQSYVNINGELTPYFLCKIGVRQRDPLSPYLFNLTTNFLCKLFAKGRGSGRVIGLDPLCDNQQPVTNCHYVDDIILFLKAEPNNVENAWWTMMMFKAIFGIKMNLDKTELYPINLNIYEA